MSQNISSIEEVEKMYPKTNERQTAHSRLHLQFALLAAILLFSTGIAYAAWGPSVTIDAGGNVGNFTSLEVVNGNPAIAYRDIDNANVKYVRATNNTGTSWGAPVNADAS